MRLWRFWLSEDAEKAIASAAECAHPKETGGVLVGVRHRRRPWVTKAIEVPCRASTGSWFEIIGPSRKQAVESARETADIVGYLGEWHSHPADMGPSGRDLSTMKLLAADPDAQCERPLLIVARRRASGYDLDAREISHRGIRRLRMVKAGPLPRHLNKQQTEDV